MSGTPCAKGHVCLFGSCTKKLNASKKECLQINDDFVTQNDIFSFRLPKKIMNCIDLLNHFENIEVFPGKICKGLVLEKCCNACQSTNIIYKNLVNMFK